MVASTKESGMTFAAVRWADVFPDEEVYLAGTHQGEPVAYGPHIVVNKKARLLRTTAGRRTFMHYPEELLRRLRK